MNNKLKKSTMKKYAVFFALLTLISIVIALTSSDFRIFASFLTLVFGVITNAFRNLYNLNDEEFTRKMVELDSSDYESSNETTEFNLYHSPDAVFSPHND